MKIDQRRHARRHERRKSGLASQRQGQPAQAPPLWPEPDQIPQSWRDDFSGRLPWHVRGRRRSQWRAGRMSMAALLLAKRDHLRNSPRGHHPRRLRACCAVHRNLPRRQPASHAWRLVYRHRRGQRSKRRQVLSQRSVCDRRRHHAQGPDAADRRGTVYTATGSGLDAVERAVIVAIHGNQTLRCWRTRCLALRPNRLAMGSLSLCGMPAAGQRSHKTVSGSERSQTAVHSSPADCASKAAIAFKHSTSCTRRLI
jgi:hypothetical protein